MFISLSLFSVPLFPFFQLWRLFRFLSFSCFVLSHLSLIHIHVMSSFKHIARFLPPLLYLSSPNSFISTSLALFSSVSWSLFDSYFTFILILSQTQCSFFFFLTLLFISASSNTNILAFSSLSVSFFFRFHF